MSAINKFANETEYNAHTKSTTNSEVSLVGSDEIHYDGLNIENTSGIPAIGDCLYLDSNNEKHFFYGATVNNSILVNDGYTPVGIVAEKYDNNKVLLIYKEESGLIQFCSACIQLLSGYKINGTSNNIKVRWFNSSNVKTVISNTFTDSCSDLQDFVTKFNTFLRANQVGSYQWHCELMQMYNGSNAAFVVIDNYSHQYQYQSVIESGATASIYNWNFVGQTTDYQNVLRISGGMGYRTGCNKARLMEYYSTNASASSVMTDSPTDGNGIVNKTDFDNGVYPNIKSYYGDWESYIDSTLMQRKPTLKGDQIKMPDAYGLTKAMANVTYNDINGNTKKLFSAADWCNSISVLNNDWYLTGINELNDVFIKIKNDASDPINIAMLNMSNKKMVFNVGSTNYYRWVNARRSSNSAWLLDAAGTFCHTSIHSRNRAVACQLLSL